MMNNSEMLSSLLHNKECPFGYRCLANDCIECAELQPEIETGFDCVTEGDEGA